MNLSSGEAVAASVRRRAASDNNQPANICVARGATMPPNLEVLSTFVEVVDRGGFTAAARRLGISKSIASRRVMALESQLQVRLLQRTTRGLAVTEAGQAFVERCRAVLADLREACEQVSDTQGRISGLLRITAPASFAHALVTPVVAALADAHPLLDFDIVLDERRLPLVEEGFDVAIRAGTLADSTLMARPLGMLGGAVVASPAYLARHGRPSQPAHLAQHVCLDHSELSPHGLWRFATPAGEMPARLGRRLRVNGFDALCDLARRGVGVGALPSFTVSAWIERGELEWLMPAHPLVEHPVWAVFPRAGRLAPKHRVLLDALLAYASRPTADWGEPA
jgi:DNA-binding transcriptional LysR family regulator